MRLLCGEDEFDEVAHLRRSAVLPTARYSDLLPSGSPLTVRMPDTIPGSPATVVPDKELWSVSSSSVIGPSY